MIKYIDQSVSRIAIAVLIGSVSLAHPVYANDYAASPHSGMTRHHNHMDPVEQRIKTMHDKLRLAPEQEAQWDNVADVMRENEADIHKLVQDRHENEPANAVEDLKSYEAIADAHADGLRKLVPVFESFYDNLTDEQQTRADSMFGRFEGRSVHKASSARSPNNQE